MPSKIKDGMTGIWFDIDEETNRKLTESARINQRSKRKEARFRLADHLAKFNSDMKKASDS